MTDSDPLTTIRQRVKAASPGPWRWEPYPVDTLVDANGERILYGPAGGPGDYVGANSEDDAEFIAHARCDIARLLAIAQAARDLLTYDPSIAWPEEADFTPLIDALAELDNPQE